MRRAILTHGTITFNSSTSTNSTVNPMAKLVRGNNNLPVRLQKALCSCRGTPSVCHMLCTNNTRPSQQQDSALLSLPQKVNWGAVRFRNEGRNQPDPCLIVGWELGSGCNY